MMQVYAWPGVCVMGILLVVTAALMTTGGVAAAGAVTTFSFEGMDTTCCSCGEVNELPRRVCR